MRPLEASSPYQNPALHPACRLWPAPGQTPSPAGHADSSNSGGRGGTRRTPRCLEGGRRGGHAGVLPGRAGPRLEGAARRRGRIQAPGALRAHGGGLGPLVESELEVAQRQEMEARDRHGLGVADVLAHHRRGARSGHPEPGHPGRGRPGWASPQHPATNSHRSPPRSRRRRRLPHRRVATSFLSRTIDRPRCRARVQTQLFKALSPDRRQIVTSQMGSRPGPGDACLAAAGWLALCGPGPRRSR